VSLGQPRRQRQRQGLTLVHFSAQLEPFLSLKLPMYPSRVLRLSRKVNECKSLASGSGSSQHLDALDSPDCVGSVDSPRAGGARAGGGAGGRDTRGRDSIDSPWARAGGAGGRDRDTRGLDSVDGGSPSSSDRGGRHRGRGIWGGESTWGESVGGQSVWGESLGVASVNCAAALRSPGPVWPGRCCPPRHRHVF